MSTSSHPTTCVAYQRRHTASLLDALNPSSTHAKAGSFAVTRGHNVILCGRTYCVLCGHNIKGALRPAKTGKCSLFHVPLCTMPHDSETGLGCFQEWHQSHELKPRIYRTQQHDAESNTEEAVQEGARGAEASPAVEHLGQLRATDAEDAAARAREAIRAQRSGVTQARSVGGCWRVGGGRRLSGSFAAARGEQSCKVHGRGRTRWSTRTECGR